MKNQTDGLPNPLKVVLDSIGYITYFLAIAGFLCIGLPVLLMFAAWPPVMRTIMYTVLKGYAFFLTRLWLPALQVYSVREIAGSTNRRCAGRLWWPTTGAGSMPPSCCRSFRTHRRGHQAEIRPHSRVLVLCQAPRFCEHRPGLAAVARLGSRKMPLCACKREKPARVSRGNAGNDGKAPSLQAVPVQGSPRNRRAGGPWFLYIPILLLWARRKGSIFPLWRRFSYAGRFLPACRPEPGETAAAFAERVRRMMAGELAVLDKGTLWIRGPNAGDASGKL